MKIFGYAVLGILGLVILGGGCAALSAIGAYNGLQDDNAGVDTQWAQVENAYQRRADLIPNLVETVKGYVGHESDVLKSVAQAQASVGRITIDPKNLTPEKLEEFSAAQAGLGGALQKLMVVTYSNPNLKADKGFDDLRVTLEGTENRITHERREYNLAAGAFNAKIKNFPTNFVANFAGMQPKALFKAEEGANKAPKVNFGK